MKKYLMIACFGVLGFIVWGVTQTRIETPDAIALGIGMVLSVGLYIFADYALYKIHKESYKGKTKDSSERRLKK